MKKRDVIFNKFNGKCAYTGKSLPNDWQIDHIIPYCKNLNDYTIDKHSDKRNLFPTLKIVNHYKRSLDLEEFRSYMTSFHLRLAKLPKNTIVAETIRRKAYMLEVAEAFGITIEKPFDGMFYFEKHIRSRCFPEKIFKDNPIFKVPMTPKQSFNITGETD